MPANVGVVAAEKRIESKMAKRRERLKKKKEEAKAKAREKKPSAKGKEKFLGIEVYANLPRTSKSLYKVQRIRKHRKPKECTQERGLLKLTLSQKY